MMAVEIKAGAKFDVGIPKPLFDVRLATGNSNFDVSADGRFLIPVAAEQSVSPLNACSRRFASRIRPAKGGRVMPD
jgi:hypothetical protein